MPSRRKTSGAKTRGKRSGSFKGRIRLLAWILLGCLLASAAVLAVVLRLPPAGVKPLAEVHKPVSRPRESPGRPAKTTPSSSVPRAYEEPRLTLLERKAREIDMAVLQALAGAGKGAKAVLRQDVRFRSHGDQTYPQQTLVLDLGTDQTRFVALLRQELAVWAGEVSLVQPDPAKAGWEIRTSGVTTHLIMFNGALVQTTKPTRTAAGGNLVLVIDDLGENLHSAERLTRLGFPVTFSVLPGSTRTREIVQLGRSRGMELLLHLPMQPREYPETNPGPGALLVDMSEEQIRQVLAEDLAQVPGAVGVNNHMGSRFTGNESGMRVVMQELARQKLFFMDSLTTPDSRGQAEARLAGIPFLHRHVFLDNVQDVEAILFQLRKAEAQAARQGWAIAIGHPYETTLEALERWAAERDGHVRLVTLQSMVQDPQALRAALEQ